MALSDTISALATRVGQEIKAVRAAMALDNAVVHKSGDETVTGVKTFGAAPLVPTGSVAGNPVRRDDPRLSDARTPTGHAASHAAAGSDPVTPAAIGAATRPVRTQAELVTALSAGGDVYVDSSVTIALSAQMNITLPTRLIGGTFTRVSGEAFRITSSNVEITGATITGGAAGSPTYDATQKLVRAVGTSSARLTGIDIHDNSFFQCRGDCVWLEWCEGARVTGNTIRRFLYSGVMVISGLRVKVADNDIVDGPLTSGVVNTYGIAFTDLDNTAAARCTDCSATANTVHLVDWEGIDTHGGDSIVINGNIVTACPRGIALVAGNASRVTAPVRCIVNTNRIDGTGMRQAAREGIYLGGLAGTVADAVITGNTVDNNGAVFFLDYYDRTKTNVGANSAPLVPWTTLPLSSSFTAGTLGAPQYMVDGNRVFLRGSVVRAVDGNALDISTALPAAARPAQDTYIATVKALGASSTVAGVLLLTTAGVLRFVYGTETTSRLNFPLSGSVHVP